MSDQVENNDELDDLLAEATAETTGDTQTGETEQPETEGVEEGALDDPSEDVPEVVPEDDAGGGDGQADDGSNILSQDDLDAMMTGVDEGASEPGDDMPSGDLDGWGLTEEDISGDTAEAPSSNTKKMEFDQFASAKKADAPQDMEFILDIPLQLTVEVGRTHVEIGDLLQLGPGSIVELEKLAGEPLEVFANNKLIARGEAVIVNEKLGIRLTDVVSKQDRIENLH